MISTELKIEKLKEYFKNQENTLMAFLFGSRAKEIVSKISDWDIACYFKSSSNFIEVESDRYYPEENRIWGDLVNILETDNVDFIVLNRAPASIAASVIRNGIPLAVKDARVYSEFMLRVTSEAEYRGTICR